LPSLTAHCTKKYGGRTGRPPLRGPPPRARPKLPFVVVPDIAPVMADVTAVMPQIAVVGAQVAFVVADVALLLACSPVVAIAEIFPLLAPILPDVSPVVIDISSVLPPVNSVMAQVSAIGTQVSILAQRKGRSQHGKHQQTNDSSSHIASLVLGPDWPLGSLNTGVAGKFWASALKPERAERIPKEG
jgi:hypothetical protein